MEIVILGSGGMMPMPNRFLASAIVRRNGEMILFDCGEATQIALKKSKLGFKNIDKILITHTHADHVTGLIGLLMLISQTDRIDPLQIYGPPRIKDYVDSFSILDPFLNYLPMVNEIDCNGRIFENSEYYIECTFLHHTKPCIGYNLVEKERPGKFNVIEAKALGIPEGPLWNQLQNGNAVTAPNGDIIQPHQVLGEPRSGRKICYITDTRPCPQMIELAKNSDMMIAEGMFKKEDQEQAISKKHSTACETAEIARDAKVKSLVLTHISPRYTNHESKFLVDEVRDIFPNTIVARDLMRFEIPLYK